MNRWTTGSRQYVQIDERINHFIISALDWHTHGMSSYFSFSQWFMLAKALKWRLVSFSEPLLRKFNAQSFANFSFFFHFLFQPYFLICWVMMIAWQHPNVNAAPANEFCFEISCSGIASAKKHEMENRKNLIHFGLTMLMFECHRSTAFDDKRQFFHSIHIHSIWHRCTNSKLYWHLFRFPIHSHSIHHIHSFIHSWDDWWWSGILSIIEFGHLLRQYTPHNACQGGHLMLEHFGSRWTSCKMFNFFLLS